MDSLEQVDLTRALVRVLEAPEDKVEASTKTVAMQVLNTPCSTSPIEQTMPCSLIVACLSQPLRDFPLPLPISLFLPSLPFLLTQAICHLGGDVDAYSVGVVVAQTQSADASQRRAAVQAMGKLVKPRDVHHISRLVFLLQVKHVAVFATRLCLGMPRAGRTC